MVLTQAGCLVSQVHSLRNAVTETRDVHSFRRNPARQRLLISQTEHPSEWSHRSLATLQSSEPAQLQGVLDHTPAVDQVRAHEHIHSYYALPVRAVHQLGVRNLRNQMPSRARKVRIQ